MLPNAEQECQPLCLFPVASRSATNKGDIPMMAAAVLCGELRAMHTGKHRLEMGEFQVLHAKSPDFEGVHMCLLSQGISFCMARQLGNIGISNSGFAEEKVFWIAF